MLSVVGCATQPISNEVASHLKRVGVISMAAREFEREYVGFMVFGNENETKDITAWGIDKAYEDQIAAALERITESRAIRVPYSVTDFSHVNDLNGPIDHPLFWDPNWDSIRTVAKAYCDANSLDAIIFATRERSGDFIGGTNQRVDGAGIYARQKIAKLHLVSRLTVFDCSSAKPLLLRRVSPLKDIPHDLAVKPIPQWTAQDEDLVRQGLIDLPGGAWENSLRTIFPQR